MSSDNKIKNNHLNTIIWWLSLLISSGFRYSFWFVILQADLTNKLKKTVFYSKCVEIANFSFENGRLTFDLYCPSTLQWSFANGAW